MLIEHIVFGQGQATSVVALSIRLAAKKEDFDAK
jgi:hypothetical protein